MKTLLTTSLIGVSLWLAAPAFAQADPHAGHHPAAPIPAPTAPADATKPSQTTMAMRPPNSAAHHGKMAGGEMMTPAMMKKCMHAHAKHQRRRSIRHRHH